ncbi:integrase [Sphingopyxis lindanitolerans]|uniref:Integrase n=1 Tax=Sphingopyxis lindanitolerans TaxID=2054227 RepID=A0A2S8B2S6_9SPHN|nr:site-specific integrase [Sphingopyxis lindanitolerans]PQM26667.1 integrase [Sphingopyxis lindanitolerans]
MASFQKRKNAWRVTIRRKGKYISATFDTKTEANAWAIQAEAKILKGFEADAVSKEPEVPVEGIPATEALQRYANEVSSKKRGARWEQIRIEAMIRNDRVFKRPIVTITGADISEWRDKRLRKVSPSTVNREMCLLSSIFNFALRECRMGLTFNPCALVSKPRKPRPRSQRISLEERQAIIAKLGWNGRSEPRTPSQWVGLAFYFALETAMRKGEILSLRWSDVHFEERYAHLDITKNGDERDVPLSKAAIKLLKIVRDRDLGSPVIPVQSGHFGQIFTQAKRDAGLDQIHFHDSRREAATTMAPKLSNVLELAAITGHKSLQMLQIYYKPRPQDLAARLDL